MALRLRSLWAPWTRCCPTLEEYVSGQLQVVQGAGRLDCLRNCQRLLVSVASRVHSQPMTRLLLPNNRMAMEIQMRWYAKSKKRGRYCHVRRGRCVAYTCKSGKGRPIAGQAAQASSKEAVAQQGFQSELYRAYVPDSFAFHTSRHVFGDQVLVNGAASQKKGRADGMSFIDRCQIL